MSDGPFYLKWIPPGKQPWQVHAGIVVVPEGESVIQVARCRPEGFRPSGRYFLLLNGKPLAVVDQICPTCSGILQTGYAGKADIEPWLTDIREAVKDERSFEQHYEAFLPLIALFGRGVYSVGVVKYALVSPDGKPSVSQFGMRRDPSGLATGNGPYGPRFLEPLQPAWKIDRQVVQQYIDLIAQGARPMGIAYYLSGFLSFLLDGHHKAAAYSAHNLEMPCLTIYPLSPIFPADGEAYWDERGGFWLSDDDNRTVKTEELPPEFVEEAKADFALRTSPRADYLDDAAARRYLRLLGASG